MRVALIGSGTMSIPPDGWGAVQRVIWNLHRRLLDAGIDSTVVNVTGDEELGKRLASLEPDLVHLHADGRLEGCLRALISRPAPLVVTSHDWRQSRELPPEIVPGLRLADGVIALSPLIRERIGKIRTERVYEIPNGVDTRAFRPLPKRPNSVVAVGRNAPRKRFGEIARFFESRPEYRLTLCGPGMCGGRRRSVPVLPAAPNITLLDNQPESVVARLMGESEFFVHLAELEASPLVIREAMACGCRVWTRPQHARDLRNVALSWDDAVADVDLGRRAALEAVESFDWAHIVRRHAAVYEETLGRWRAHPSLAGDARERYRSFVVRSARPSERLARARRRIGAWVRQRLPAGIG